MTIAGDMGVGMGCGEAREGGRGRGVGRQGKEGRGRGVVRQGKGRGIESRKRGKYESFRG